MYKNLLRKYFNNNYSGNEVTAILDWFEKYSDTDEGKLLLFEVWDEIELRSDHEMRNHDLILERIHLQMNLNRKNSMTKVKNKKPGNFIRVMRNVAAILLLPAFIFGFYMSSKYFSALKQLNSSSLAVNEVFSSVDAITKVTLPDGSKVWLNHRSSLRYPAMFENGSRSVELIGEGYFEVTHDSENPFIVKTGELDIIAVGTTFNILAYPEEGQIETSLINGIVKLQKAGKGWRTDRQMEMKPSDLVVYSKENDEFLTRKISDDRYFSWKDGKLIFNKEPMNVVVKKLSRWFNVDIQLQNSELNELTFTGTFINETLYQVLELISLVTPVNYTISEREETIPGTFSKRKVSLYSKTEKE